jgi:hypothetical protein
MSAARSVTAVRNLCRGNQDKKEGTAIDAMIRMMAMVTISSIKVNPDSLRIIFLIELFKLAIA